MKKYNYKVMHDKNSNEYYHGIIETATELVIDLFYFEDDCKEYLQFLNKGGAFDGFTPAFILNKVKIEKDIDINAKFDRIVS